MLTTMSPSTHPVTDTTAMDSSPYPVPLIVCMATETTNPSTAPIVTNIRDDSNLAMTMLLLPIPAETANWSHLHWSSHAKELETSDENSIGHTIPMTLDSLNRSENTIPKTAMYTRALFSRTTSFHISPFMLHHP